MNRQLELESKVKKYCKDHNCKYRYNAQTKEYIFYVEYVTHLNNIDEDLQWITDKIDHGKSYNRFQTETDQMRLKRKKEELIVMVKNL